MKTKIKLLGLGISAITLGIVAVNAQAIDAQQISRMDNSALGIEEKRSAMETRKAEKVCSRIDDVLIRLEEKIGKSGGEKLKERAQTRNREMEENRSVREADLNERRVLRDENRNEFYDELKVKAGDDTAKIAAVEKFKTAVETAIKTRREAIDNAKETLNQGIDKSIADREASVEALRVEFKKEIESAISKAKKSCEQNANNDDLKLVVSQLKDDIKIARENYKAKVNEVKKVQGTIQTLRETRKASVKLAIENFKAAMKAAQEELQKVMGA